MQYFGNFVPKSDQKLKSKNGMNETYEVALPKNMNKRIKEFFPEV